MPLPHNALVLVADGRKILFFRNHGDENQIDLRTEAHEARRERRDREIKTDAPGIVSELQSAIDKGLARPRLPITAVPQAA